MNIPSIRQPSAFLPVVMSLAALTSLLSYAAAFGAVEHEDEGAPAHIFQLLLVAQLPIVAYFGIKWLPQAPKEALRILALQVGAGLSAIGAAIVLGA